MTTKEKKIIKQNLKTLQTKLGLFKSCGLYELAMLTSNLIVYYQHLLKENN